jgi:hypothetical protein
MRRGFVYGIDGFRFFLGVLAVCLSIGFLRYFNQWVYFPFFPNVLDSTIMAIVGFVLLYDVVNKVRRANVSKGPSSRRT